MIKKFRLGDRLIEKSILTVQQLEDAIDQQRKTGKRLGETLIAMGLLDEPVLLRFLSEQLNLPYVDLDTYDLNEKLVQRLPEAQARRYQAILLQDLGDALFIGLTDPLNVYAYDEIAQLFQRPLKLALVSESALTRAIDRIYRRTEEITELAKELAGELAREEEGLKGVIDEGGIEDASVVKLLQSIYEDAIQARASDIHIEPGEHTLRIRFRVDGLLRENILDDNHIAAALVQRLKLKAKLNIAERRIPQDGRFKMNVKGRLFDVRVSTMPIANGESVAMRLLDQTAALVNFESLGMPSYMIEKLSRLFRRPQGMLLVTGPTGSGKTTTLYSVLSKLNQPEKKIITVEDPVEYRIDRVNQVQVNYKIDLDFARVLRSILRQDPDIVMVGEIRDNETAQIAMRAAMTGHLVLATLHTNDAVSSAMRLMDMGCEGYMVASALKFVLAQRLVRKICPSCREDYSPTLQEAAWLTGVLQTEDIPRSFKKGAGCQRCSGSGYQGRVGVYELVEPNAAALRALCDNDTVGFIDAVKDNPDYTPLARNALNLAITGITTISEAIWIAEGLSDEEV